MAQSEHSLRTLTAVRSISWRKSKFQEMRGLLCTVALGDRKIFKPTCSEILLSLNALFLVLNKQ